MTDPVTATGYYAGLAAALHQVADQIATLTGAGVYPAAGANLFLSLSSDRNVPVTVAAVDAVATALGGTASTVVEGRGPRRRAECKAVVKVGPLHVTTYAAVPAPPTRAQTVAELKQENSELRAQLARRQAGESA